uniref:Innexin n=2 Tax=Panagrellus redivivus TaxID=6233 RepID=A0A7E4VB15_PANRE
MVGFNQIWSRLQKKDHDDDTVDRMNYSTTAKILSFFAAVVMAKQNVGSPLQCWIPAEYKKTWEQYIESYCFVENTYYVNASLSTFPNDPFSRKEYQLKYYQWTPYIFLLSAFIAYAPKLVFKFLNSFSNLVVSDIIQFAYSKNRQNVKAKKASDNLDAKALSTLIVTKFTEHNPSKIKFGKTLTITYFLMKVLELVSVIANLGLLMYFVDASSPFWGATLIKDLYKGNDWRTNGFFPRVTFCDLKTRDIGQHRPHTIQCVLMLNMFIEKMYIFLWAWFLICAIFTVINLIFWAIRVFNGNRQRTLINDALQQSGLKTEEVEDIDRFIRDSLSNDGIVILRLIDSNLGYINMAEICRQLYENFTAKKTE